MNLVSIYCLILQIYVNFNKVLYIKRLFLLIARVFLAHAVIRKWLLLTDPDDKMAGIKVCFSFSKHL